MRFQFLMQSDKLTDQDKQSYEELVQKNMSKPALYTSLRKLTTLLEKHYEQQVIVLIDEYDVPLAKANEQGYYEQMVLLLRNLFENVLKTNESLKFAVLTGCLRVAKESIFTGLNNFKVFSITDVDFDEYFGFNDAEVKAMLQYYGQEAHLYQLVIPNREVRNIMTDRVMSLFKENVGKDGEMVNSFCNALIIQKIL